MHINIKLLAILCFGLALSACDFEKKQTEQQMLNELQPEINFIQKRIDKDTEELIEQDKIYKSCIKENAQLRKIAEEHRKKYPEQPFTYKSTQEQCKIIQNIEKYHHVDLFFRGFLDKKIGYCNNKRQLNEYEYINYIVNTCTAKYKRSLNIELCEQLFKKNVHMQKLQDDIGIDAVGIITLEEITNFSYKHKLLTDIRGSGWQYIYNPIDDMHTLSYGNTYKRIYAIGMSCLHKSGKLKNLQIKRIYNDCILKGYSQYFCECFSNKSYAYHEKAYTITDEVERKYAQQEAFDKAYNKCMKN